MNPIIIFCHILYSVPIWGCPTRREGLTRTRTDPGAVSIFRLDNESVPLYTGTCPYVENQHRARLPLQHAVSNSFPRSEIVFLDVRASYGREVSLSGGWC
jgi:hypothetical protein